MVLVAAGERQVVARRCRRAAAAGVAEGMTLAHARAMLGEALEVAAYDASADAAALEALAQWALRFSPVVALDRPDGLLLDVTGCERLFAGLDRLMEQAARAVQRLGFAVRLAVAPTAGAAWALAHYGQPPAPAEPAAGATNPSRSVIGRVDPGQERQALAPLPVEALRIAPSVADALAEVGIEQVGQVLALPPAALRRRFGPDLPRRIDQALGKAWEPLAGVAPLRRAREEMTFPAPIQSLQTLQAAAETLLDRLLRRLEPQQHGVTDLQVDFRRLDAPPESVGIVLSRPSADRRHLRALLTPRIERVNLGFGVEGVAVTARQTAPRCAEQLAWWPDRHADPWQSDRQFGQLLDTLVNRIGPGRVLRLDAVETHVPEEGFRYRPAMSPTLAPPQSLRRNAGRKRIATARALAPRPLPDRPSLLLEKPEPLVAMTLNPDGPVLAIRWRGRQQRLRVCVGPERIAEPWWDRPPRASPPVRPTDSRPVEPLLAAGVRDYFKVQDETGRWLWIFRRLDTRQWFLHGQWA